MGDAPAQAAVILRHHVFKAGDVYVGQGEVPALQGRLRNRGDERVSRERRFGRFEKNLACAGARARGMYARERARSAETYLLLRVEHHVDRLGARAPGLERGARPADVDDTCHDARKSRINAREGRRRNSLGAGSDEPHARAVRGERPRERENASLSHASANGVTTRARAACVRVMVRARRAGRFKYNRRLWKVSRVARTLKCRSNSRACLFKLDSSETHEATAGTYGGGPSASVTRVSSSFFFGRRMVAKIRCVSAGKRFLSNPFCLGAIKRGFYFYKVT